MYYMSYISLIGFWWKLKQICTEFPTLYIYIKISLKPMTSIIRTQNILFIWIHHAYHPLRADLKHFTICYVPSEIFSC